MKYYLTGKKGFKKYWWKAGLKYSYIDLLGILPIFILLIIDLNKFTILHYFYLYL